MQQMRRLSEKLKTQAVFLEALAKSGSVCAAASNAGVNRRTFYRWREEEPVFAEGWKKAQAMPKDDLEHEAIRRAVNGVEKPVYRGGEIVGHVTDYSDSMLMFLLKAHYPEKYDPKFITSSQGKHKETSTTPQFEIEGARDALKRKFAEITQPAKER